jgi:nitrate reductase NapE component
MSTPDLPSPVPDPQAPPPAAAVPPHPYFPDGTQGTAFQPSTFEQKRSVGRTSYTLVLTLVPVILAGIFLIGAFGFVILMIMSAGRR